jgi:mitosis inhibitor protein kinase SWE1
LSEDEKSGNRESTGWGQAYIFAPTIMSPSPVHLIERQEMNELLCFSYQSHNRIPSPPFSPCIAKSLRRNIATPTNTREDSGQTSPHTPQESFTPADPINLSISVGQHRQDTPSFNSSTGFNPAFLPATPTAPRDHTFPYGPTVPVVGVTNNDVDTSLTARFAVVHNHGVGEFSQVYRVEKPIHGLLSHSSPRSPSKVTVWAVKKTKKPYSGNKDRERKLREVEILRELRNNDHIINFVDFWESKGHLYIQTEFCEDGNLKDFLTQTGYKGRLDDFRIWKIMLELSLVSLTSEAHPLLC